MRTAKNTSRTCEAGHRYFKSSDCPVCPICERTKAPTEEFLLQVSAPARRALLSAGINSLKQLSRFSEEELLALHGIGPSAIPKLKIALAGAGLSLRI